jgi:hypothetical protein
LEGWGRNNKQRNISRQESLHIPFLHHWDRLGCSEWSYLPMPPIFVNQSFPREESADQHIHDATQPLSQVPTAHSTRLPKKALFLQVKAFSNWKQNTLAIFWEHLLSETVSIQTGAFLNSFHGQKLWEGE